MQIVLTEEQVGPHASAQCLLQLAVARTRDIELHDALGDIGVATAAPRASLTLADPAVPLGHHKAAVEVPAATSRCATPATTMAIPSPTAVMPARQYVMLAAVAAI